MRLITVTFFTCRVNTNTQHESSERKGFPPVAPCPSKRGAALIITLALLVLVTALVLTLFLTVTNERTESAASANQNDAQHLASGVVNLVKSTITQATYGYQKNGASFDTSQPTAWASQPGLIRTWDQNGAPYYTFRLYSSGTIATSGTLDMAGEVSLLTNWKSGAPASGTSNAYNALWCDLNAPAISGTGTSLVYPIVTPPADKNSGSVAIDAANGVPTASTGTSGIQEGVQGFAITAPQGSTYPPEYTLGTASAVNNPAPMPVKWLYVLKDGSFVTPAAGNGSSVTVNGASKTNPIVGRVAYWTDDETCKVNLNTASEGVYWDKPYGQNREDQGVSSGGVATALGYSLCVPVQNEFQRLPGHPAFTSLSAIFGGTSWLPRPAIGLGLNSTDGASTYTGGTYTDILPYYTLSPRYGDGGTKGGTRGVQALTTGSVTLNANRLYTSTDELYYSGSAGRLQNNAALSPDTVRKTSFFLTTASVAPETTLFEQPRISLWPIQVSGTARNAKDNLLAFAATVSGSAYYFQRASEWLSDNNPGASQTSGSDAALPRNVALLNYLYNSSQRNIPGFGASLQGKYTGGVLPQILMEMFDTIRSLINTSSQAISPTYSYAPFGAGANFFAPVGLGSVVPANMSIGGTQVKGFGRFPTIAEVVICFMATDWVDQTCLAPSKDWADMAYTPGYAAAITSGSTPPPRHYPDWVPHWGDANMTPIAPATIKATPIAHLGASGSAILDAAPSGAKGDGVPDDVPAYTGATPTYTTSSTDGSITSLLGTQWTSGTDTIGFNGIGDPQTKEIQVCVYIIPFLPVPGNPPTAPAVRYQIEGLEQFAINGQSLGLPSKTNATLITRGNQYVNIHPETGISSQLLFGSATDFLKNTRITFGSCSGATANTSGSDASVKIFPFLGSKIPLASTTGTLSTVGSIPGSSQYGLVATTSTNDVTPATNLLLSPGYKTLRTAAASGTMAFTGGPLTIRIYPGTGNSFDPNNDPNLIQDITLNFPNATFPVPQFIRHNFGSGNWADFGATSGSGMSVTTPYYYSGFLTGTAGVAGADSRIFANRLTDNSSGGQTVPNYSNVIRRGDVMRSVYLDPNGPSGGDIRMVAGLRHVPSSFFKTFPGYDISGAVTSATLQACAAGVRINFNQRSSLTYASTAVNTNPMTWLSARDSSAWAGKLVGNLWTNNPNAPFGLTDALLTTSAGTFPGDWNSGVGGITDGPYMNMADQGFVSGTDIFQNVYFPDGSISATGTAAVATFSPNRQISSPVLFGSLPTGIDPNTANTQHPWQTLLFCPNPAAKNNHPGFAVASGATGPNVRPPFSTAPDHLFLDAFWMPIIEPYAISEPFATAGKVNLNCQIAPFSYIQRSTGLYAVLKAMKMPALSGTFKITAISGKPTLSGVYKQYPYLGLDPGKTGSGLIGNPSWRYNIDIDAVLAGMNAYRFALNDVYHSASELCTIFMVPLKQPNADSGTLPGPSGATPLDRYNATQNWWDAMTLTGDNLRENPYDYIYSRITTKSNTFTVHMRVQTLKQVPNRSDWTTWDETKDQVVSEYRGSSTIERFVDPNDTIPDFAQPANYTKNLAPYYKWRTVSQHQFVP